MSNEASAASCTNLYLHYDNTAAVVCEYVPAAFLAHFVLELDLKQPLLKQLYIPGILDTRNEKLYLIKDRPSATWNRISRRDRVRTLQPFFERKIADLVDDSVQDLKFGVVYCNLLHDSWPADDQVLLPFLYRREEIAWAQQQITQGAAEPKHFGGYGSQHEDSDDSRSQAGRPAEGRPSSVQFDREQSGLSQSC